MSSFLAFVLLAVDSSPLVLKFVLIALAVVVIGLLLRMFKQTHVIIYIITGVIIGPGVLEVITDAELISNMGSLGLVLLLFFIGMEISLQNLIASWRVSVIGTLLQTLLSVLAIAIAGYFLEWNLARTLTLGFVVSLSSTAVIVKLLQENGDMDKPVGQAVLGVLLVQDVLIVPMMIALNYLSGTEVQTSEIILQIIGGVLMTGLVAWMIYKKEFKLPFHKQIKNDHELQIFFAFGLCFGFAAISGFFGLSTALGAFVAGLLVATAKSTEWFHESLYSLKVIFVALFFISVGMLIDLQFFADNILLILGLVLGVFILNNIINSLIMRMFKMDWKNSLYAGSLLSQVGEFSFVLGNVAFLNGIITDYGYQLTISLIALSLLLSPLWISFTGKLAHKITVKRNIKRTAAAAG